MLISRQYDLENGLENVTVCQHITSNSVRLNVYGPLKKVRAETERVDAHTEVKLKLSLAGILPVLSLPDK